MFSRPTIVFTEEIALKTELDDTTLGTPSSSPTSLEPTTADTEAPTAPLVDIPGGEIDPLTQIDDDGQLSVQANNGVNDEGWEWFRKVFF